MKPVSVIIPALNEEQSIGKLIDEISTTLDKTGREFEIIVIDDGSDDKTFEIIKNKKVHTIRHPAPGGYGLSLRDGIKQSRFNNIVIIDADGTYPVDNIPEFVDTLDEYDMVIGARTGKYYRESFLKHNSRILLQMICEFVTGRHIPDVNSGLRAFKKGLVLEFEENFCLGFSFTTTITLAFHLNGYFIKYVPIAYCPRGSRKAHVKIFRDSLRTAQIITQSILYYNPIKLFILLSFIVLFGALIMFTIYYMSGSIFFLMTGAVLFFSSFMYFGLGLIAEAIRQSKHR
ncbi:MAG: glycosyltransferase family 2 protein [Planctomycetes bacterium]|nr:glycosyltransferase family 2 protein [Planctomycetota bacterium]